MNKSPVLMNDFFTNTKKMQEISTKIENKTPPLKRYLPN